MLVALEWIARGAALVLAAILLYSVGGPLATDDLWWHLSLGYAYAEQGPWLAKDPHLFTAVRAPDPNAWLFDRLLAFVDTHAGLRALRLLHVALVASILAGVWHQLRRRAESPIFAALGFAMFIAVAAYRLVQLRPELATIGATILLTALMFGRMRPPSAARSALAIALCAVWSNLHPGYLLGPVLLLAVSASCFLGARLGPSASRSLESIRFQRYLLTAILGLAATGLNPDGYAALQTYTQAGVESVGQAMVVDEWRAFDPFQWPTNSLPPAPLTWLVQWFVMLGTVVGISVAIKRLQDSPDPSDGIDVAVLVPLAAIGCIAPLLAVRFLWLAFFPLLLGASHWRSRTHPPASESSLKPRTLDFAVVAAVVTLVPLFIAYSERKATPFTTSPERYAQDYDADRYYAHTAWFLRDAETEGALFQPYFMGGFLNYWLSPQHAVFVDGSLNLSPDAMNDYGLIQRLGQTASSEAVTEVLDRWNVDFYIGVGLPQQPRPGRPWRYTAADLAASPGWMLVFKSLRSAVYMRDLPRNAKNLDRIETYYRDHHVPFDRKQGLKVFAALEQAPEWSIENGLAPRDFPQLKNAAEGAIPGLSTRLRDLAHERLARTYAVLGLCEQARRVDARVARGSAAQLRRQQVCTATASVPSNPRKTWLTAIEAGQIKAVERPPSIRAGRPRRRVANEQPHRNSP
ncbi:MAG: hypothetical protein AB8G23_20010 [Myxococcota bacterium]